MPETTPPIIGLTGGIGSGKSAVAAILRDLGCFVSNADELARASFQDDAIKAQIVSWWGDAVLDPQGEIDRSKVATIVFADPDQRVRLEQLTHPWIESQRQEAFTNAPAGVRALVIDAPLLVEAGIDEQCDAIIFVDTERNIRLSRVTTDRGWDDDKLQQREDSQLSLDVKRKRADYRVSNNGAHNDLLEQVHPILNQIAPLVES
ncbi:MAG: dephospho-CoA kinase [Planctomycetota bacterium]|nr:dephospho-CoA kinase [Planctomycetota bacterium]